MFPLWLRAVMAIAAALLGWHFARIGETVLIWMMISAILVLFWGYFRTGSVVLAFRQVQRENYVKAGRLLRQTAMPQWLNPKLRGYYWFTAGMVSMTEERYEAAEAHFTKALQKGVQTPNNEAIIFVNLASMELKRGNLELARDHIKSARNRKHHPELDDAIRKMRARIDAAS